MILVQFELTYEVKLASQTDLMIADHLLLPILRVAAKVEELVMEQVACWFRS